MEQVKCDFENYVKNDSFNFFTTLRCESKKIDLEKIKPAKIILKIL